MTRFARLLAMTAPALLVAGCGTSNSGMEPVHQPVVQRSDYAFDVATGGSGLADGEAQRLAGWMSSLRLGYGDRIAIDGAGSDSAVRDAVAAEAARFGLLVSDDVPVGDMPVAPGTARVVVSRMTADVPGCPDHSRVRGVDLFGHTNSNYGCANNSNLAAMVADPADLVRGQTGGAATDPVVAAKAIETFRKGQNTGGAPLTASGTKGGQ
ncbi:pilus assembly protein CpaD [Sphingomonas guangdongensis]|uniref:Pilus assembly protein CpaD n=1 Tax=Sphingomonas guangdongensis TaxID=1141890 RepID=A0A285QER6_9SPHN|nr:CpaD family pilus assembly protein [Sphingomonas guangdongensis]SOB78552.1 pilus assembly protein CpaD [Sphingomonas guangdongensis]